MRGRPVDWWLRLARVPGLWLWVPILAVAVGLAAVFAGVALMMAVGYSPYDGG